jgi:murein DD-endopeptidase MepM/ murein hydrolase activator NlpD
MRFRAGFERRPGLGMRVRPAVISGALLLLLPTCSTRIVETPRSDAATARVSIVRGVIAPGTSLAVALEQHLPPSALHALVAAARPVYDLARVAGGQPFGLALAPDGALQAFSYRIDDLTTLRVRRTDGLLRPELLRRHYDVRVVTIEGTIASSLFAAVSDLGEEDQLALDLADIFAWDVDFHTEIQPGDSFAVAVEKLSLDGQPRRNGRILAARFVRGSRTLSAVYFAAQSGAGYYDPEGRPLRKAFLRSPIKFGRISSRFSSARLHPILKVVRPHRGIDYAAPTGTPVLASANGVVALAGWLGGYGKTIRLRHANGFETLYGHLASIRVKPGERVAQGQTIGAVGSTGLASGPHLDYRMFRRGMPVNALTVQLPPAPPLTAEERPAFEAARACYLALMPRRPALADAGAAAR